MVRPTYVGFRKSFFALAIILLAFSIFAPMATLEAGKITYFEGDVGRIHVIASVQKNAVYNKFIFGDDWIELRYKIKGEDPTGIEIKVEGNRFIMEFEECRIVWQKIPHMDALKFSFVAKQDIKGLEIKFKVAKSLKVHGHRIISQYLYFDVSDALKWVQAIDVSNKRVRIKDIPAGTEIDPSIGVVSGDADPLDVDASYYVTDSTYFSSESSTTPSYKAYMNIPSADYTRILDSIYIRPERIDTTTLTVKVVDVDTKTTIWSKVYSIEGNTNLGENPQTFQIGCELSPNTNGYWLILYIDTSDITYKYLVYTGGTSITYNSVVYYEVVQNSDDEDSDMTGIGEAYYTLLKLNHTNNALNGTYEAKDGYNATYRWNGSISVAPTSLDIYLPKGYNITYVNVSDGSTTVNVTSGFTYNDYNDTHWKIPIDLSSYSFSAPVNVTVGAETVNAIYDIDAPLVASDDESIQVTVCLKDGLGNALSQDVSLRVYLPDNPDQPVFWDKTHQHLITFYNGPQKTAYGWEFDGVDDYGLVDPFSVNSQNVTVIAMINTMSVPQVGWDRKVPTRLNFPSFGITIRLVPSTGNIEVGTAGPGYDIRYVETAVLNEWQVWAIRITDGNTLSVFKNGSKVFTRSKTYPDENSELLSLGGVYQYVASTAYNGEIAYVFIYNRALSDDEISTIYNDIKDFSWDNPITDGLVFAFTPDMPLASGSEVWNATVTSDASSGMATFSIPYNVTTPGYLTVEAVTNASWKGVITSTITVIYNESLDNFNRTWEVYNDTHIKYVWNVSLPDAPGYRLWIREGYENITAEGFTLKDGYLERLSPYAQTFNITAYARNSIRNFSESHGYDYVTVSGQVIDPLGNPISDQPIHVYLYHNGQELMNATIYPDTNGNFSYTFTNLTAGESYKIVVWTNYWAGWKELLVSLPELPSSGGGLSGFVGREEIPVIMPGSSTGEESAKTLPPGAKYALISVVGVVAGAIIIGVGASYKPRAFDKVLKKKRRRWKWL